MLRLIPPGLHRLGLRVAHVVRMRLRKAIRPDLAGVAVVLRDSEQRVLLVRHSYGPTGWAVPGGGISAGEDPADAARREMREELACELSGLTRIAIHREVIAESPHTAHVYTAAPLSEPRVDRRELLEARWFHLHELRDLRLTRVTHQRLVQLGLYNSDS